MRYRLFRLIPILSLVLACDLIASNAPTESPPTSPIMAEVSATPTPLQATATPTIAEPSPTATIPITPSPTTVVETDPPKIEDLTIYEQAMLPEFVDDVALVAARGVSRYRLDIELDPKSLTGQGDLLLYGTEHIRYTNTENEPLSEIYVRLYPNLPTYGGNMTVEKVMIAGNSVETALTSADTALQISLNSVLEPGDSLELQLNYQTTIPKDPEQGYNIFSYANGTIALAGFYPAIAVYDDTGWNIEIPPGYGDATYLDASLYQVELTVPDNLVVAASGSLVEMASHNDGTKTLHLVSGPMRDFYVVMSENYDVVSETVDGILVNSYYPSNLEAGGMLALRYAVDALRVFNERFGMYPYAEFDIAATPTSAGGVEYPGIVVINETLYRQPGGFFPHASGHEVAHQWWYGLVGNDQIDEPWLDESLTNYSTLIYWEAVEGGDAAQEVIDDYFMGPYNYAQEQGSDRGVMGRVDEFSPNDYGLIVYGKGPLFFDALRENVGDEIYFEIMKTYYSEYKYKIAQPNDLFEVIEAVSQQDVTPLVETWLQN